jgi:hypothetical protein
MAGVEELPVLYGRGTARQEAVASNPDGVVLSIDVFGGAFFMLTRYEELVKPERDEHGRFPATASLARAEGFLHRPIVNEYAELLWSALQRCWPGARRRQRSFSLHLTHDVDHPLAATGIARRAVLRNAAGDVVRRRAPDLAARRLMALARRARRRPAHDPYNTFDFLLGVSESHALRSSFYFMAPERPGPLDGVYDLHDPWIRGLLEQIHARGHEIGLHPSYDTYRDAARIEQEFARLRRATDALGIRQERWGGRQHYLQWESPTTWAHFERAGLDYDSSVGYADAVGFRSGICHEHPLFDLRARRTLRLRERPLIAMDVTLSGYLGLSPDAARTAVLDVAAACRRHGGQLVLLWHNNEVARRVDQDWYRSLVGELVAQNQPAGGSPS